MTFDDYVTMTIVGTSLYLPDAPQSLTVTPGVENNSLTWTAPDYNGYAPVTGYNIYRGTSPDSLSLLTTVGNQTNYNDTDLTTPGVTYYYNVTALNTDGEGPSSNQDFGMPITAPSVPLSLTATPSNNGVNLTWDQPTFVGGSPITGYEIFRGTSPGDETSLTTIGTDLQL